MRIPVKDSSIPQPRATIGMRFAFTEGTEAVDLKLLDFKVLLGLCEGPEAD